MPADTLNAAPPAPKVSVLLLDRGDCAASASLAQQSVPAADYEVLRVAAGSHPHAAWNQALLAARGRIEIGRAHV